VTEPNEFEEFLARQERRKRIAIRVIDILTGLALAAIVADPEDDLLLRVGYQADQRYGTAKEPVNRLAGNPIIGSVLTRLMPLIRSAMNCRSLRETFGLSESPHAAPEVAPQFRSVR
jgi:hypothetical protein